MSTKSLSLEERALEAFDTLHARGELLWESNEPVNVPAAPFDFQFRICTNLNAKPQQAENDPGWTKDLGAFDDPNPLFTLSQPRGVRVNPTPLDTGTHRLILNKFCFVRPQYLIHTTKFLPQAADLERDDLAAAWAVLHQLPDRHLSIFNNGIDGGSSLGHRHLHVWPLPEGFELWPDRLTANQTTVPNIPFIHAIHPLTSSTTSEQLIQVYQQLLKATDSSTASAHNMLLTKQWILVIPRRSAKIGLLRGNASTMLGISWLQSEESLAAWKEAGVMNVLRDFGVPVAGGSD